VALNFDPNSRMKQASSDKQGVLTEDRKGPRFTPFTDRPELQNRDEVARALLKAYPPELRDKGISGTVVPWVLIDETGKVVQVEIDRSTEPDPFGYAANAVVETMKFKPALNNGKPVSVWIKLPIVFKTK